MKRLFQFLSRTSGGAFIIDSEYRIIFWNKAAEEILEYTDEEVNGRFCYEILGGRDEQGRTLCQCFCRMATQTERDDILPNRNGGYQAFSSPPTKPQANGLTARE